MSKLHLALVFCLITTILCSQLSVYIPQCAYQIIPTPIQSNLANFGYIPYGQSYISQVFLPQVSSNAQLCSIQNQPLIKSASAKSLLLVRRGICKFTQKVLNAQKLGADVVVVYDNQTTDKPKIIMKNDGHGHLVTIPSAFVSNKDGKAIIRALQDCNKNLFLKQYFQVFQSEVVDLALWMNLNNRQSYVLLRDFYKHDYYSVIDEYVKISVRFRVQAGCPHKALCRANDCLGSQSNKFCIPTQQYDQISGQQLLKQSLRMYVLFYSLPQNKQSVWFEYMNNFDQNVCNQEKDIEYCSYENMKKSGVSQTLIDSIKLNVTDTLKTIQNSSMNIQNVFYWVWKEADQKNIVFYPEAVINGKNFYGLFKAPQVFEMICSSLLAQPKQCYSFINNKDSNKVIDNTGDLWFTVLFILFLMTLGFLVALLVYTRLIKKEVNQQMSMEVNKMVQNYVTLTDQKSATKMSQYAKMQM